MANGGENGRARPRDDAKVHYYRGRPDLWITAVIHAGVSGNVGECHGWVNKGSELEDQFHQ